MSTDGPRSSLRLVGRPDAVKAASALLEAGMSMAYQPIVHLGSGAVIAYEALARPRHPDATNPLEFFTALENAGLRLPGERLAFETALMACEQDYPKVKLFLNASPTTLVDPQFDVAEFLDVAERHGFSASDLVVEVTESEAIEDLDTLAKRGERLRQLGIGLAVDDAGAGHASFKVITRLRPSYIKIDRDLVSNVDTDGARHAFIEAMVRFSREIGSRLIAEGVETEAELASLAGLGVEAGQGWFIARPSGEGWVSPAPEARRVIATAAQRPMLGAAQVVIGELARPAATFEPDTTLAQAHAHFAADPALGLLVLTDRERAVAQLTRRSVERVAAATASWALIAERPAAEFADHQATTVYDTVDIVEVGAILAAREREQLVEDVVVTDQLGRLVGVAGVRDVLRALADVRRRGERDLNPLSGLSGPGWLETELSRRVIAGDPVTVLFADLDGFRRLNDLGGFDLGDDVLRVVSQCLRGVVAGVQGAEVFHVGADDFVLLVPPARYEEVVSELVRGFEHEVAPYLRLELRTRGAAWLLDELRLSMAAIDLAGTPPPGRRHTEWARECLTSLMPVAKQQVGHSCVRRSDDQVAISRWVPVAEEYREIVLGQIDPAVILAALHMVERSWQHWETGGHSDALANFPGPGTLVARLRDRYLRPLRLLAERALAQGRSQVELAFSGPEGELLELLDRLALVSRQEYVAHRVPVPPELALIDRVVRMRARVLEREDRTERIASGQAARTEA